MHDASTRKIIAKCVVRSLIYQFIILILTGMICFDVLGTRKCQNFKFLTKSRTCYTLLNFRKNPTGGVSIEMAEPIVDINNYYLMYLITYKYFFLVILLFITL
jgi:hypothetical protein